MSKSKMSEELFNSLNSFDKKYYSKNYSNEIKLGDYYVIFTKPSIETHFCFGFDEIGDPASINESNNMAVHVKTSPNYLIEYNLRDLRKHKEVYTKNEMLVIASRNEKRGVLVTKRAVECGYYDKDDVVYCLNESDKERLLAVVEEEIEKFTKRLNTYVKRYGTSCVKSWTYSVND